jgi:hypothetical protein
LNRRSDDQQLYVLDSKKKKTLKIKLFFFILKKDQFSYMFNQVTFLDRSKTNQAKMKPSLGLITIIHI